MKRRMLSLGLIGILLIGVLALTACAEGPSTPTASTPDKTGYTKAQTDQSTFLAEAKKTEDQQQKFDKNDPVPQQMDHSIERQALIRRMNLLNVPEKVGYLYVVDFGKIMAYYVINGKVTSVNSLLTDPQQIITKQGYLPNDYYRDYTELQQFVVDSPDLNGTYGPNGPADAVFFFTTDGAYGETDLKYMYFDKPLHMSTQPELVRSVK